MTAEVGTRVVHRRYVPYSHAHYAGNLVDGAYSLGLFGDVATEMCIRTDGDEGLFASYSDVQFRAPVRAGDVLEITAELVKVGTRSRVMDFTVLVVARGEATEQDPEAKAQDDRTEPDDQPLTNGESQVSARQLRARIAAKGLLRNGLLDRLGIE